MDEKNTQELQETLDQLKAGLSDMAAALTGFTSTIENSSLKTLTATEKEAKEKADALARDKKRNDDEEAAFRETLGQRKNLDGTYENITDRRNQMEARVTKELEDQTIARDGFSKAETVIYNRQHALYTKQLAELGYKLDADSKATKATLDLTKQQQDHISELKKAQATEIAIKARDGALVKKRDADLQKASVNPADYLKDTIGANKSLGDALGTLGGTVVDMNTKSMAANVGLTLLIGTFELGVPAIKALYAGFDSMTKSLLAGERGQMVNAKAVSASTREMNKGVQSFGSLVIGIGTAVASLGTLGLMAGLLSGPMGWAAIALGGVAIVGGTLTKVAGDAAEKLAEYNEMSSKVNDDLYKGFRELGKASMTGTEGMTGVFKNLQKMGLTVAEFDKFGTVIKANSKEMTLFGSTAQEGINKFADVAGGMFKGELGRTLELMGIQSEEQYEHTAKYMALQTRLGLIQGKSVSDLQKGAANYIEELDKLAAITGASRREQEDARNAIMAIEQLRAAMIDEEAKSKISGDTTKLKEIERAIEVATSLQVAGQNRLAAGTAHYVAAGGITSTESAEAAYALRQTLADIKSGKGSTVQRAMGAANEAYAAASSVAATRRIGGDTTGLYSDKSGSAADFKRRSDEVAAGFEKAKKEGYAGDIDSWMKDNKISLDKNTQSNVDMTRAQMQEALRQDTLFLKLSDTLGLNEKAFKLYKSSVDTLQQVLEKYLGPVAPVADPPDRQRVTTTGGGAAMVSPSMGRRLSSVQLPNPTRSNVRSIDNAISANPTSSDTLQAAGLKIKKGDVQRAGSYVDPALIEIAKQIQAQVGDFQQFTGFNDQYHIENAGGSSHVKGKAFDFVLNNKPSKKEADKIISLMKSLGIDYAQDEYHNPSAKYTGGHFHGQLNDKLKAYDGGVFDGPISGYSVEMHGREAIVPMPNPDSMLSVKDSAPVQKAALSNVMAPNPLSGATTNNDTGLTVELFEMLAEKLDTMIDKLGTGNDIQYDLLKYSRV